MQELIIHQYMLQNICSSDAPVHIAFIIVSKFFP